MFSTEVEINPVELGFLMGVLENIFLSALLVLYGMVDAVAWIKSKIFGEQNSATFKIDVSYSRCCLNNTQILQKPSLLSWLQKKPYVKIVLDRDTIFNACGRLLICCFWTAHISYCCRTYLSLPTQKKKECALWTKAKCHQVYQKLDKTQTLLKLAPNFQTFLQNICSADLEETTMFFDQMMEDIMSGPANWILQFALPRLRSTLCENGVFIASVALQGCFAACLGDVTPYRDLLNGTFRTNACVLFPLAIYANEKCVFPYDGDLSAIGTPSSELLLRTMDVAANRKFKRYLSFGYHRNQESYKDRLTVDLSYNTNLGFVITECSSCVLERMLWIADSDSTYFTEERWQIFKNMRKTLLADLRKFDVRELIHYSLAGVVFLSGKSDRFFSLIGNSDAPVRLNCQLPKPTFQDVLNAGLAKSRGDGNYVMCDIPGVSGYFKGIKVGDSLLFVKCADRTKFNAKATQEIL